MPGLQFNVVFIHHDHAVFGPRHETAGITSATDSAAVSATVFTAAIGVTAGSSNVNITLVAAVSVATNMIDNDVQAHVLDSTLITGGALDITATSVKDIDALGISVAGSVTAGSGTFSLSGAVGVAQATNTIGGTVHALIQDADQAELPSVKTGALLTMMADNTSTIDSTLVVATLSVTAGSGTVALALSGAASVTENTITSAVLAGIDNSYVDAGGDVSIDAGANSTINANTIAVAVSVSAGSGTVNISGAVGVAIATNSIGGSTQALITDSTVDAHGTVDVILTDTATVNSNVIAAAVSVSASSGSVSGSLALAVSLAENTISGSSRASIENSTVDAIGALSDVNVSALANNEINAVAAAASVSVAASSSVGISISGAVGVDGAVGDQRLGGAA
ncbi:hypothetical protein ACFL0Q_08895, partial [Thermodesulfobacteriota bacterium]